MSKIVLLIYRIVYFLYHNRIPIIPNIINKFFIRIIFGCQIGTGAKLGKNVILGYGGLGIVIHNRSIIGDNVNIGTGVTIGGTSGKKEVPIIGNHTIISSGAKIIGPIKIGNNCIIGANAVVISDIEDNCVAVGIPAKIIKRNINIKDYL
jgi:serine O-acetyltransferase